VIREGAARTREGFWGEVGGVVRDGDTRRGNEGGERVFRNEKPVQSRSPRVRRGRDIGEVGEGVLVMIDLREAEFGLEGKPDKVGGR